MPSIAEQTGEQFGFCLVPTTEFYARKLYEARWELVKYPFFGVQGDLYGYLLDTLAWIPTRFGSLRRLVFDKPVIEADGLPLARELFLAWLRLFSLGADPIEFRGSYRLKGENVGQERISLARDLVLGMLSRVVAAIDQAITSQSCLVWDVRFIEPSVSGNSPSGQLKA